MTITTLNRTVIESVSTYKYHGFWIDNKVSFKKHITELTKSLNTKLSFLYRNRSCMTHNCRKQIV